MISTKNLITGLRDVPREWVFEYYLNLGIKLTGQEVRLRSPFSEDKVPSFYVYVCSKRKYYVFHDFSTAISGEAVELVRRLQRLDTQEQAGVKIIEDYKLYLENHGKENYSLKQRVKYKVTRFEIREWTKDDANFWTKYGIGSVMLKQFNVKAISRYEMTSQSDEHIVSILTGPNIYGYFKESGELCKLYQPYNKNKKFLIVNPYLQGSEQLKMNVPFLVICSSLKDVMGFYTLGYKNAEAIAPDSESSVIKPHVMAALQSKYQKIVVLFDNDTPGKNSAQKYLDRYGLKSVLLEMSKDLTDSIKDHGLDKVRELLTPLLRKVLYES